MLSTSWAVITATVIGAAAPPLVLGAAFEPSNFLVAVALGTIVGAAMLTEHLWLRVVLSSIALFLAYGFLTQLGSEGGSVWHR
jgi:tetrahydromethanopterin S-methyltransferase subunit E